MYLICKNVLRTGWKACAAVRFATRYVSMYFSWFQTQSDLQQDASAESNDWDAIQQKMRLHDEDMIKGFTDDIDTLLTFVSIPQCYFVCCCLTRYRLVSFLLPLPPSSFSRSRSFKLTTGNYQRSSFLSSYSRTEHATT